MINVVLDTNIIIDYTRKANPLLRKLLDKVLDKKIALFIPSIVILELMSGQETHQKDKLDDLEVLIKKSEFIPLDYELSKLSGFIVRDAKGMIQSGDAIVAATALSLNAKLATRNKKHFSGIKDLRFYRYS